MDDADTNAAEASEALREFARALGRMVATAEPKMGVRFDMDDPEIAKELMLKALYAVVPSLRKN